MGCEHLKTAKKVTNITYDYLFEQWNNVETVRNRYNELC